SLSDLSCILCLPEPMRHGTPLGRARTRYLLLPQRRPPRCAPNSLELLGLYPFYTRKRLSPLWLAAESQSQELAKIVAPVGSIIPQNVAIVEDLNLPNRKLIVSDFQVADEVAP